MAFLSRLLMGTLLCLLAVSFAGALHPAGDSFAVLRLPLAVLALVMAMVLRRTAWLSLPGLGLAGVALLTVLGAHVPGSASPGPALVLYQKNLLFKNVAHDALVADIEAQRPDFITFQEVSRRNRTLLKRLRGGWPHQILCPFAGVGGVAVLSRFPVVEASEFCVEGQGLAGFQADTADGPVWVMSIHLHWPWPYGQKAQTDVIMPVLSALQGPKIIGGDFNMVAWSHTLKQFQTVTRTRRATTKAPTFRTSPVPIPMTIDHVLAGPSDGMRTSVQPPLGSDHNGILARINLEMR